MRTACSGSAIASAGSVSASRCGTARIRSSRSGCSGSAVPEGNHGEDVKELYYFLDATPTSSYLKALYKYPQAEFPYADLVTENARRGKGDREYELEDTGVFEHGHWDVGVEYAKAGAG